MTLAMVVQGKPSYKFSVRVTQLACNQITVFQCEFSPDFISLVYGPPFPHISFYFLRSNLLLQFSLVAHPSSHLHYLFLSLSSLFSFLPTFVSYLLLLCILNLLTYFPLSFYFLRSNHLQFTLVAHPLSHLSYLFLSFSSLFSSFSLIFVPYLLLLRILYLIFLTYLSLSSLFSF